MARANEGISLLQRSRTNPPSSSLELDGGVGHPAPFATTRKPAFTTLAAGLVATIVLAAAGGMIVHGQAASATFGASPSSPCDAPLFTKNTLKELKTEPVGALLQSKELKGERKFETSDVMTLGEYFYAICDSSWAILKVHESFQTLSPANSHIGTPQDSELFEGESGFEGIFHDATSDSFFVVRESVDISGKDYAVDADDDDDDRRRRLGLPPNTDHPAYHALIMEIAFPAVSHPGEATSEHNYVVVEHCPSELRFDGDSKGFEGATSLRGKDGVLYVLGLCEGNWCKEGKKGQERGNGKIVVMAKEESGGPTANGCYWKTVTTIDVPPEADFQDYSAIALHQPSQSVVITSQENSQAWVGTLEGATNGEFDPTTAAFGKGKVLDFPRNDNCEVQHCNIEGIHFVEGGQVTDQAPQVLVAVSDKMKGKGKQPARCLEKDQSFSLFAIP